MNEPDMRMEMVFVPAKNGYMKVFVYGFYRLGSAGYTVAEFNGLGVTVKGFNKKRTIIKAIETLHHLLKKKNRRE